MTAQRKLSGVWDSITYKSQDKNSSYAGNWYALLIVFFIQELDTFLWRGGGEGISCFNVSEEFRISSHQQPLYTPSLHFLRPSPGQQTQHNWKSCAYRNHSYEVPDSVPEEQSAYKTICPFKLDCKINSCTPFSTLTDTDPNWFTHYIPFRRMSKSILACAVEFYIMDVSQRDKPSWAAEQLCQQQTGFWRI